jgi:hypothetical protein
MGFCGDIILPKLGNLAMHNKRLVPYRKRVHDPLTPAWRRSSGVATEPPGHPKAQASASIGSRPAIWRTLGPMTFMHEGKARRS